MLFKYDKDKNELIQIEETAFSIERLMESQNIETWIRRNPSILSEGEEEDLIIISEQKASLTKKRLDLLGVDKFGNIVIIELKRDLAEKMAEFQAITYASSYVNTTFDEACKIYAEYLEKNKVEVGLSETTSFLKEAENTLGNFCASINIPEDFNKNQRIILVAGDFSQDLLSAVTWLILKGIRVECIKLILYKDNNELFIQPKRILPTPDISENIVKIRIAEEESTDKKRKTYQKWEGDIEAHYERLSPPLNEHLKTLVSDLKIEPTNLSGSGFHLINGTKKIMVSTYVKSKIEFRFAKSKKEEIEKLLSDLSINTLTVKDKGDIEPYGIANPTPSIDYKVDVASFEDIKKVCKEFLEL